MNTERSHRIIPCRSESLTQRCVGIFSLRPLLTNYVMETIKKINGWKNRRVHTDRGRIFDKNICCFFFLRPNFYLLLTEITLRFVNGTRTTRVWLVGQWLISRGSVFQAIQHLPKLLTNRSRDKWWVFIFYNCSNSVVNKCVCRNVENVLAFSLQ